MASINQQVCWRHDLSLLNYKIFFLITLKWDHDIKILLRIVEGALILILYNFKIAIFKWGCAKTQVWVVEKKFPAELENQFDAKS